MKYKKNNSRNKALRKRNVGFFGNVGIGFFLINRFSNITFDTTLHSFQILFCSKTFQSQ